MREIFNRSDDELNELYKKAKTLLNITKENGYVPRRGYEEKTSEETDAMLRYWIRTGLASDVPEKKIVDELFYRPLF